MYYPGIISIYLHASQLSRILRAKNRVVSIALHLVTVAAIYGMYGTNIQQIMIIDESQSTRVK
jgi:hypothetical protein